jgi:tetratricopeptide (TPR) repeat protein
MTDHDALQLNEQALDLFRQGRREEALAGFDRAAAAFAQASDPVGQGEALNNMAVIHRLAGRHPEALAQLAAARSLFSDAGDDHRLGQALANLGDVYQDQKLCQQAFEAYSDAIQLLSEAGDRLKQAQVLRAASLAQLRCRQWFSAIDLMRRSLEVRPSRSVGQQLLYLLFRIAGRIIRGPEPA